MTKAAGHSVSYHRSTHRLADDQSESRRRRIGRFGDPLVAVQHKVLSAGPSSLTDRSSEVPPAPDPIRVSQHPSIRTNT